MSVKAYASHQAKAELELFEFSKGPLGAQQVDIKVHYCGICHSDISMLNNDWGNSVYPLVPGHEIVGEIIAKGDQVKHLELGQKVGLGWFSESCMTCDQCMTGNHNLCYSYEQTVVNRHGGFADEVRCHSAWAIPLPESLDIKTAGPLFCGGITVFNPIMQYDIKPVNKVGVIGIGGLGHLAIQFLNKWGCEVYAFTSTEAKAAEAKAMGAHHVVNSRSPEDLLKIQGKLDFILNTVNVEMDWNSYFAALKPKGKLHMVGAVLKPIEVPAFTLIAGQKSLSGTPLGSPATISTMVDFCSRHDIKPITQHYKMSEVNEAIENLKAGKARYRLILENDFR